MTMHFIFMAPFCLGFLNYSSPSANINRITEGENLNRLPKYKAKL